MRNPQKALPTDREILEFLEQIRRASIGNPVIPSGGNGECDSERAEIVLDSTSQNSGTTLAVYGKLE